MLCKDFTVFDCLRVIHTGKAFGDCSLTNNPTPAIQKIQFLGINTLGAHRILAPRPGFTDCVTDIGKNGLLTGSSTIYRGESLADAGIAYDCDTAITFCNADCHIGLMVHHKTKRWAMLHLSLSDFDKAAWLIIQTIEAFHCRFDELSFWCGGGIGPCCNGKNEPGILKFARTLCPSSIGEHPPIKGPRSLAGGGDPTTRAIDNLALIKDMVDEYELGQVEFDHACSACQTDESGESMFFSNVYQANNGKKRNCFIAKMMA